MYHFFDVDLAKEYGVNCAILLANFEYWINKNKANETNFYDGRYWTFNSKKAFAELFPYLGEKQIRSALDKLINEGLIMTGNYNASAYDRTLWYAFTEKGESICLKRPMDKYEKANGLVEYGQPIPNNKPYINTNINTDRKEYIDKSIYKKSSKFQKPTLDELKEYCSQMGYKVDAEKFYLYYEQCGWTVGKNKPMKDWRASLRLWNMNQAQYQERAREQSKVASLNFSNEECEKQLKDEVIPF